MDDLRPVLIEALVRSRVGFLAPSANDQARAEAGRDADAILEALDHYQGRPVAFPGGLAVTRALQAKAAELEAAAPAVSALHVLLHHTPDSDEYEGAHEALRRAMEPDGCSCPAPDGRQLRYDVDVTTDATPFDDIYDRALVAATLQEAIDGLDLDGVTCTVTMR